MIQKSSKQNKTKQKSLGYIICNICDKKACCCCSVTKSCPTLWNPMNCSTPGFPDLHHLLELAQAPVHWVGDAIQPSHPLLSHSPSASNLSQHQGLFQWVSSSYQDEPQPPASVRSFLTPECPWAVTVTVTEATDRDVRGPTCLRPAVGPQATLHLCRPQCACTCSSNPSNQRFSIFSFNHNPWKAATGSRGTEEERAAQARSKWRDLTSLFFQFPKTQVGPRGLPRIQWKNDHYSQSLPYTS